MLGDYAVKCKTAASSQFDPDKHEPEIEKQLFLEMAKLTKIASGGYSTDTHYPGMWS